MLKTENFKSRIFEIFEDFRAPERSASLLHGFQTLSGVRNIIFWCYKYFPTKKIMFFDEKTMKNIENQLKIVQNPYLAAMFQMMDFSKNAGFHLRLNGISELVSGSQSMIR